MSKSPFLAVIFGSMLVVLANAEAGPVDTTLDRLLNALATTPEQHQAIADHYRTLAADARAQVERHRTMEKAYERAHKVGTRPQQMQQHCDRLITQYQTIANEYDELAVLHENDADAP